MASFNKNKDVRITSQWIDTSLTKGDIHFLKNKAILSPG